MIVAALVASAIAGAACTDDAPTPRAAAPSQADLPAEPSIDPVRVVTVTSQRCHRPTLHRGVGTDLGNGRVLTAAHVVDGDLRLLEVDGATAEVIALDERLDLAVLAVAALETSAREASGSADPVPPFAVATEADPGAVTVLTPERTISSETLRVIALRVDDVTRGVVHERPALEIAGDVDLGTSGAPVLDAAGAIAGVVVLSDRENGVTYAVRPPAIDALGPAPTRRGCLPD